MTKLQTSPASKASQEIDKAVESFREDVAEAFGVETLAGVPRISGAHSTREKQCTDSHCVQTASQSGPQNFHGTTITDLEEMVENVEGK